MEGKGEREQQINKEEKPSHHCLVIDPSVTDREDGVPSLCAFIERLSSTCHKQDTG